MSLIRNPWARAVTCLIAGAATSEIVYILFGDHTKPRGTGDPNFTWLYALIYFLVATSIVKTADKKAHLRQRNPPKDLLDEIVDKDLH